MKTRTQFTGAEWRVLAAACWRANSEAQLRRVTPIDGSPRLAIVRDGEEPAPSKRIPVWLPFAWILGAGFWLLLLCVFVLCLGPEP
jgi:hypothetical protein